MNRLFRRWIEFFESGRRVNEDINPRNQVTKRMVKPDFRRHKVVRETNDPRRRRFIVTRTF